MIINCAAVFLGIDYMISSSPFAHPSIGHWKCEALAFSVSLHDH